MRVLWVRIANDATNHRSVRFSDGLTGTERPGAAISEYRSLGRVPSLEIGMVLSTNKVPDLEGSIF